MIIATDYVSTGKLHVASVNDAWYPYYQHLSCLPNVFMRQTIDSPASLLVHVQFDKNEFR